MASRGDMSIQCPSASQINPSFETFRYNLWQWSTSSSQVFTAGFQKKTFVTFIFYIKFEVFITPTMFVSDVLQFMLKCLVGYVWVCAVKIIIMLLKY